MKMINLTLVTLLYIILVVSSCQYENEEEYYSKTPGDTNSNVITTGSGLFAFFPFEQSLDDTTLNRLKFDISGMVNYAMGYNSNYSFEFDGASSLHLFTGYYDTLTICFWFKASDQLKNIQNQSTPTIFDYGAGAASLQLDGTTGATTPYVGNYSQQKKLNNVINCYTEWNFVLIELVKYGKCKIRYFNRTNDNYTWSFPLINEPYRNAVLTLGSSFEQKNFFKGTLDNLQLYYRGLSEEEIEKMLNLK